MSIPIFLGAPDPSMVMGVLPGHKMLLEGEGYEAVKLTIIGSLFCLIVGVIILPLLILIVPVIYELINPLIGYILLIVIVFMILKEKNMNNIFWSFSIFTLAGILGILTLSFHELSQPLFHLLSGLFGTSTLVMSLKDEVILPEQHITEHIHLPLVQNIKTITAAVISGWMTSMFPGLGSAQAAILCGVFFKNITSHAYLVLVGGINTVNFFLSLVTFYTIDKARNGAVIVVKELLETITIQQLTIFAAVALIVGGLATVLALQITKVFAMLMEELDYQWICIGIIGLIVVLSFVFDGLFGFLILFTATALGMLPPLLGVGRNHAMGCLLLPVLLFFLL